MVAVSAIMAGISLISQLGGSLLEFTGKSRTAKKQREYYDWYRQENEKSIYNELSTNITQLQNRYFEELMQSSIENRKVGVSNMQAQATAEVSALENGLSVQGSSIETLMKGYEHEQALNDYYSAKNAQLKGYQLDMDIKSLKARAQNAINTAEPYDPSRIIKPSIGASLLGALGTSMDLLGRNYTQTKQDDYFSKQDRQFQNSLGKVGANTNL